MVSVDAPIATLQKLQPRSERIVLQIEDNTANAEVVNQILARRRDLKLETVSDGPQGIAMACALLPDVILLDMKMPGMSGLEVLLMLQAAHATSHIPVVALSSNAYPSEINACFSAGVFRYLTKPYKIEDLMSVIDAALQSSAQNRPTME